MAAGLPAGGGETQRVKSTPQTAKQISPHMTEQLTVGADHHHVIREAHGKKATDQILSYYLLKSTIKKKKKGKSKRCSRSLKPREAAELLFQKVRN